MDGKVNRNTFKDTDTMRIIYNSLIPFNGFRVFNFFGILLVKKNSDGSNPHLTERTMNHEAIHTAQMKELLYIPFYLLYCIEFLIRIFTNPDNPYNSLSFEREAYYNEYYPTYLSHRKPFAFLDYIRLP